LSKYNRSIKSRRRLGIAAVAILATAMQFSSRAIAAPLQAKGYYIAVSGVEFTPGKAYSPEQIQQLQNFAAPPVMHRTVATTSSRPGGISQHAVARSFTLYNLGYKRSATVYDSNWGPATEFYCSGSCRQVSKYETQLHRYVTGGYSKLWQLTLNVRHVSGN
jgi:hypothetical protein